MATELGQAYVQIMPSAKGISNSISKQLEPESSQAGKSAGGSIASNLKSVILAAGIGAVIGKAISVGGELQQNLGGTEAVFGDFANKIQASAGTAYKNMGMSASDYMGTANKMGSLFQGSGLTQQQALDMTSAAMQRAADVASVMGVDTSMAMESIAGAAKGNFAMMDNLGVAMNATTLQAYALEKGINFDWNTATQAEKSELAMKMFMDRTSQYAGNFAKESVNTFSGSLGAMKASWTDTLAGLSTGQDMAPLLNNLASSVVGFASNLIPMVLNVLTALPGAVVTFLTAAVPQFIEMGSGIIAQIANGFTTGLPQFLTQLEKFMTGFQTWVTTQLPTLMQNGIQWIIGLANGILQGLPNVISSMGNIILNLLGTLLSALPTIMQGGFDLITGLAKGLFDNLPAVVRSVTDILGKLISLIIDKGPAIISKGFELIGKLATGLLNNLPAVIASIGTILRDLIGKITAKLPEFLSKGWDLIKELAAGLVKGIPTAVGKIPGIINAVLNEIGKSISQFVDMGKDLLGGLAEGIGQAVGGVISKAKEVAANVVAAVKGFFGIASPSRVFMGIGKYLDEGLAVGIKDNVKPISKAMDGIQDLTNRSFESEIAMRASVSSAAGIQTSIDSGLINSRTESTKQAANLTFVMAGHRFKAFVDDITKIQDRDVELELAY